MQCVLYRTSAHRLGHSCSSAVTSSSLARGRLVIAAAKKSRKQKAAKPKQNSQGFNATDLLIEDMAPIVPPSAPPTSTSYSPEIPSPQQIYPVFKEEGEVKRMGGGVSGSSSSRWRWDDEEKRAEDERLQVDTSWNPRTGFTIPEGQEAEYVPQVDLMGMAADGQDLPPVTKQQVYSAALGTAFWMSILALFVRAYAQQNAPVALGTDPKLLQALLAFPSQVLTPQQGVILLSAAGAVTVARWALLQAWPEFATASYRSNKQTLTVLSPMDTVAICCAAGLSEELLFRGALIPATSPDWKGLLLSAVVFGALHNSGGRNLAFAAWAGVVGLVYGSVYLATQDIWVPVGAHALANMGSAVLFWDKYNKARPPQDAEY